MKFVGIIKRDEPTTYQNTGALFCVVLTRSSIRVGAFSTGVPHKYTSSPASTRPHTHPVVGVGSVVGELAHGCVFGVSGGVQSLRGAGGHVVEDEPETCFLRDHTQTYTL